MAKPPDRPMQRTRLDSADLRAAWEERAAEFAYAEALTGSGLRIDKLREPVLPDDAFSEQRSGRWQRIPLFLHIRALKPPPT